MAAARWRRLARGPRSAGLVRRLALRRGVHPGLLQSDLDALLDRADAELNPEARIALYKESGHLLVVGSSRATPNGNWPGWTNLLTVDTAR